MDTISMSKSPAHSYVFEAKVLHITWDEQPAIAIILYDVTQQQTILSLKLADAYKDTLLATISHELRTPLNGILGMLQIIQKCVKDAEILRYIDICKNSGQLLLSLVNSILDLNQIRAKKLKLYPEKLNVHSFLKEICALFEFQCTQKNLLLNVKVSPKVPRHFVTDKNRLSQILINLMGNALKFTSTGGISILVNPTTHVDYVELSIVDTGIGIKEQEKVKLFKMFGKLEDSDNTLNRQGVGLELTISDNLARLLCCNREKEGIKVDSEDKKGSRFYFVIKRVYQDTVEESDSSLEKSCMDSNVSSLRELDELEEKMKKYSTPTPKFPSAGVIFKRESSSFIKASEKSLSPVRV